MEQRRCDWAGDDPLYARYPTKWGVPVHDDRQLFEHAEPGGGAGRPETDHDPAQAENYRAVRQLPAAKIAAYDEAKIAELLANPGIVRNPAEGARRLVKNAQAFLAVQEEFGSFDAYIWRFVGERPIVYERQTVGDIGAVARSRGHEQGPEEARASRFVGPTICYAFMQAVGMVNDHTVDCFRHPRNAGQR